MPLFTEDVIIRILADSTSGVREIKKTNTELKSMGTNAKLSAKQLLTIGASFGGITAAIDLAVKAGTALIEQVKESRDEYLAYADAMEGYTNSAIQAYREVEAAEADLKKARGAAWLAANEERNTRRAQRKEDKAAMLELSSLTEIYTQEMIDSGMEVEGAMIAARDKTLEFKAALDESIRSAETLSDTWAKGPGTFYEGVVVSAEEARDAITQSDRAIFNQADAFNRAGYEFDTYAERVKAVTDLLNGALAAGLTTSSESVIVYTDELAELRRQMEALNDTAEETTQRFKEIEIAGPVIAENLTSPVIDAATAIGALGGSISTFISDAFGETKGAAVAQALINQALAITNIWSQFAAFPALATGLTALAVASTGAQIASIQSTSYANGTPPGGFTGTSDDSLVRVSSRERLSVTRDNGEPASSGMMGDVYLDGKKVGQWFNSASDRNLIRPNSRSVVTR